jgi:GntR family transcriptional regulator
VAASSGRRGIRPRSGGRTAPAAAPSLVDSAEQALQNWLAGGRYRQGDRLPPEQELAAMLGVSRGTLRSALHRLEQSGEIARRQGSGTFVGPRSVASTLDERLERLEPYSSVAARRGLRLTSAEVTICHDPVGGEVSEALGVAPATVTTTVSRVLVADGVPVAVMFDAVHPSVPVPADEALKALLEAGQTVLDALLGSGVPVTYARTRITPHLLNPRERAGRQLGVSRATAVLQLEELVFAGRNTPVQYSRDLFAPGGLDVTVIRSPESTRPAPVVNPRGTVQ